MLDRQGLKHERMHLRLDAASKRKLERAAAYTHNSLSEFVLSKALAAAEEILEQHEQYVLVDPDWQAFYQALQNPPQPNEALREGFRWYNRATRVVSLVNGTYSHCSFPKPGRWD